MFLKRRKCMLTRKQLKDLGTQDGLHDYTPEQVEHIREFWPRIDLTKVKTDVGFVTEKHSVGTISGEDDLGIIEAYAVVHPTFYHQLRVGDKVEYFFCYPYIFAIPAKNTIYDSSRPEIPPREPETLDEMLARLDAINKLEESNESIAS